MGRAAVMAYKKEHLRSGCIFHFVCIILSIGLSEAVAVENGSNFYTAAVFEHVRYDDVVKGLTPQFAIKKNLDSYNTATKTAARQGADIIVFPEWGLYHHDSRNQSTILLFAEDVPDPTKEVWNPCEDQAIFKGRPVLQRLSCMARDNALYLVANIVDIKKCFPQESCKTSDCSQDNRQCPPDGQKFFNTNVVFNRKGTLVSRYYKSHLYFEPNFSTPLYPKPAYFKTDFGLFTTFICFDMSFREAVDAVERNDVINVAYPTFWYDHFPLMVAIQYQQAWAMTNKVNLLAANVHRLGTGTIGSGIFSGAKGALVYSFNPDTENKLLISRVPIGRDFPPKFKSEAKIFRIREEDVKDITDEDQDSKVPEQCSRKILGLPEDINRDYRCGELGTKDYVSKKLVNPTGSIQVCQNEACCSLSYRADSMDEDFYLGMHTGIAWVYDTYGFCVEVCLLIRCDGDDTNEMCNTYPLTSDTKFHSLQLSGNFTTKYVYPSLLKSRLRLASTEEWRFSNHNGEAQITYNAKSLSGEPLLAAGLYGRCYDKDPPPRS